ncbi:CLU central domain [Abeliophyllum distichum]|uniref:CLU central domain n=1 Tax=Abeliophyllum distichum TaxID=126358 RepID=A0ABD1UKK8_9LAMI
MEFEAYFFSLFSSICQVEHVDKLPHVQSLYIHEMVVRACKHILETVVADNVANMDGEEEDWWNRLWLGKKEEWGLFVILCYLELNERYDILASLHGEKRGQ